MQLPMFAVHFLHFKQAMYIMALLVPSYVLQLPPPPQKNKDFTKGFLHLWFKSNLVILDWTSDDL